MLGAQYELPAFGGMLTPRIDFDYRGGFETEALNGPIPFATRTESRSLVNARVSYEPEGGDWELSAAVTNLFDNFYYATKSDHASEAQGATAEGIVGRPREVMVTVKRSF